MQPNRCAFATFLILVVGHQRSSYRCGYTMEIRRLSSANSSTSTCQPVERAFLILYCMSVCMWRHTSCSLRTTTLDAIRRGGVYILSPTIGANLPGDVCTQLLASCHPRRGSHPMAGSQSSPPPIPRIICGMRASFRQTHDGGLLLPLYRHLSRPRTLRLRKRLSRRP
jgi:hypothetical protein